MNETMMYDLASYASKIL